MRRSVDAAVGETVSMPDRIAGSALGCARILLLAVLMVLVFDRLVSPKRQPSALAHAIAVAANPVRSRPAKACGHCRRTSPPHIDRLKKGNTVFRAV